METLLCRRFELARAAGDPPNQQDPALESHLANCERCREAAVLENAIAASMSRGFEPLPAPTARRIEALVAVHCREQSGSGGTLLVAALAGAAAALMLVAMTLPLPPWAAPKSSALGPAQATTAAVWPPSGEAAPTTLSPTSTDAFSGLNHLVARHVAWSNGDGEVPVSVDYEARLPRSLANQLVSRPESATASWDGLPGADEIEDATLFVLDRARARSLVDPVIDDVLAETGSLTVAWGLHQVSMAARDDRLFVIVADPRGLQQLASAPR